MRPDPGDAEDGEPALVAGVVEVVLKNIPAFSSFPAMGSNFHPLGVSTGPG